MPDLLMPALGADMESGELVEWRIAPGGRVSHGDIVGVVETDKGAIEIEAYEEGTVEALLVDPGARVPVGEPIARLDGAPSPAPAVPAPPPPSRARPPASPAARREAERLGIELHDVTGTGPAGAIQLEDVRTAAAAGDPTEALRRAVGRLMARSKREIPHYYLSLAVPVDAAVAHLERLNRDRPPSARIVMTTMAAKAVALACAAVPEMSGRYEDERFVPEPAVRVGLAVAMRGGGVIAPALAGVADAQLDSLSERVRELVGRARRGRMRSSEAAGGSITLSSLGERSADLVHGVIYPPQVALVGMGSVTRRPWADGDEVVARSVVTLTLAGDHRVSDGRRGGRFLREIARLLTTPEEL